MGDSVSDARPVCVLDSGIGGLPYLSWMRAALPAESFVYISDTAGFPYGEKTADELTARVSLLVRWLRDRHNPKACVIACNTASVTSLAALRDQFPDLPFVGVVPAVKPAARITRKAIIGVLATRRTVEDPYLQGLIASFAQDVQVETVGAGELVRFVEERLYLPEDPRPLLLPFVERFSCSNVDVVVLGCTHFIHIAEELAGLFGTEVQIIDSRDGVSRQLQRVIHGQTARVSAGTTGGAAIAIWYQTAAIPEIITHNIERRYAVQAVRIAL
ncbi:glutamate racemase [Spirochaeta africana]|uniref:Glutamate racemase n=1 Tax=Spirochaeta africana (strain ATCC 700263 / DSM 8902 / Z-7692) TaxID=889378 RepID=H9UJL7_SPIAZ|nr:glutamate racemase [Spirochaeta africana]AFG37710.1 glutamate racemase [Spirochaeta africana DSM 8902]